MIDFLNTSFTVQVWELLLAAWLFLGPIALLAFAFVCPLPKMAAHSVFPDHIRTACMDALPCVRSVAEK